MRWHRPDSGAVETCDTQVHTPLPRTSLTDKQLATHTGTASDMVFGRRKNSAHAAAPAPQLPQPRPPPAPSAVPPDGRALSRQTDRTLLRGQRDMQRERIRLEQEERRIMAEVKELGRQGRMSDARLLAKHLVQVRTAKTKTFQAGTQMSAIGTKARMAQADASMMGVIGSATEVMQSANAMSDGKATMQMVQEFDMQSEKYKLNQEMTDEVLDSVLGGEEVGAEADDVLNSVLDEIGLEVSATGGQAPTIRPQQPVQQAQGESDAELMQRLARLAG